MAMAAAQRITAVHCMRFSDVDCGRCIRRPSMNWVALMLPGGGPPDRRHRLRRWSCEPSTAPDRAPRGDLDALLLDCPTVSRRLAAIDLITGVGVGVGNDGVTQSYLHRRRQPAPGLPSRGEL